jgi:hypothetical protein
MNPSDSLLKTWLRFLTFRFKFEDYQSLSHRHLLAGILGCWIVGMGRYWDDPRANWLQLGGVGSVAYIFALALLLWLIVKPIAPRRFSYLGILTLVAMTSPPAILYAIPVEKWMTLEAANQLNLLFLGIVALWRLALWGHYLCQWGLFLGGMTFVGAALPLAVIFISLIELNLHHVVVDIMGGIREADRTSQDAAYGALWLFSLLVVPVSCFAGLGWVFILIDNWRQKNK